MLFGFRKLELYYSTDSIALPLIAAIGGLSSIALQTLASSFTLQLSSSFSVVAWNVLQEQTNSGATKRTICGPLFDWTKNKTIPQLYPFIIYMVVVTSQDGGNPIHAFAMTPEAAPSDAPTITGMTASSQSVTLSLSPPLLPNGVLISYTIIAIPENNTYTQNISSTLSSSFLAPSPTSFNYYLTTSDQILALQGLPISVPVGNLQPDTNYSIQVLASTNGGYGPATLSTIISTLPEIPFEMQAPFLQWQSNGMLKISWLYTDPRPSKNAYFEVYMYESVGNKTSGVLIYQGTMMTIIVAANLSNVFAVRAVSVLGAGPMSNSASASMAGNYNTGTNTRISSSNTVLSGASLNMVIGIVVGTCVVLAIAIVVVRRKMFGLSSIFYKPPSLDDWEFPRQNITILSKLGEGAFGVVMKAVANNIQIAGYGTRTIPVAVKMCARRVLSAQDRKDFLEELYIMKLVSNPWHPNV